MGLSNITFVRQRPRVGFAASKKGDINHLPQCVSGNQAAPYIIITTLRCGQGHGSEGERGLTGALLDLLAPWIERKLSGEVGPALCTTLKPLVDTNLTRVIRTATALTSTCAMKARRRNSQDLNQAGAASRSDLLDWRTPRVAALTKVAGRLGTCAARQGLAMNLNVSRTFRTPLGDISIGVRSERTRRLRCR